MNIKPMTPKERVLAVFHGQIPDRTPVINPTSIATLDSMKAVSAWFPHAHTDAGQMADLAAAGHDLLGFDTVAPYFSVVQEAAALGCEIDWGRMDGMPTIGTHPITDPGDFRMPADFLDRKPIKTVLEAIRLLKKKYGDEVVIVGKVMGPWTLSYHLHGVEDFLMATILEPEKVHDFLSAFLEVSLTFARAQFDAGIDLLTWADHATGDLVSAQGYADFLLPVHQEATSKLKSSMPRFIPLVLHTCGHTLDRMHYFAKAGFDAFHFDSLNDVASSLAKVDGKILLTGCVNNSQTLLNGTPEDVFRETAGLIKAGIKLISPECAIPLKVPNQNLAAIVSASKKAG